MEAIVNNLISATGWSILHSLWQGAVTYGVLLLIIVTFPGLSARTKHNLAYGTLCTIFLGFCITFATLFKIPSASHISATSLGVTAEEYEYLRNLPHNLSRETEDFFPYLVAVYALGLLFQIVILLAGYAKLVKLKTAQHIQVPEEWLILFQKTASKLQISRKIAFNLSTSVSVPVVIGYLKPIVLFPVALATQLDLNQVEAILIHELSHIRRNDYLLNLGKTLIETILFFNPFIWLSSKFITIEREHACDDLVVKHTGTPITYAHALLKLEILKGNTPSLSMAATGQSQHLYHRIKRITDMKTNYMNAKQRILAFVLTIATVASVAWINPSRTDKSPVNSIPGEKAIEVQGVNIKSKMLSLSSPTVKLQKRKLHLPSDTSKKKKVVKIITVDDKGNKQEYNSVHSMLDSLDATNDITYDYSFKFNIDSLTNVSLAYLKSPEFRAQMDIVKLNADAMAKTYNSPEFKTHIKLMESNAAKLQKKFNSPEFKKQIRLTEQMAEKMTKHFNSPEWQKKQDEIMKNTEQLRLKFESPEWKKQIQEIKELQNSPEYKELKEKFNDDLRKLKEKKGVKSDSRLIEFSSVQDADLN